MSLSYREKSQWLMLLALILVYGHYFVRVIPGHGADVSDHQVWLIGGTIIAIIILSVIGQVVLAILEKPEPSDERDQLIALRGTKIKSILLAVGAIGAITAAVTLTGNFWLVQILIFSLVLSEIADTAVQLYHYRWGMSW
ncbi:hypothetical protein EDC38_1107 [Marinimicrobium koreense]|uniref:Uncharacterized protein n=1 Tax=Marinimicrobium koreense TaxID=306545 RepID=A0A3N1NYM1_9GAMM|nr:hypothetical protein [Marinimicrobium koreense]ROQ20501.1 hypothetical protein EDC38_1107 [Marinimicrobium koreense]